MPPTWWASPERTPVPKKYGVYWCEECRKWYDLDIVSGNAECLGCGRLIPLKDTKYHRSCTRCKAPSFREDYCPECTKSNKLDEKIVTDWLGHLAGECGGTLDDSDVIFGSTVRMHVDLGADLTIPYGLSNSAVELRINRYKDDDHFMWARIRWEKALALANEWSTSSRGP